MLRKNLCDLQNCIPITVRGWNAKELLNLSEVTDRFHVAAIQTEDESLSDLNDLQQPVVGRGETKWKSRQSRCLRFEVR